MCEYDALDKAFALVDAIYAAISHASPSAHAGVLAARDQVRRCWTVRVCNEQDESMEIASFSYGEGKHDH